MATPVNPLPNPADHQRKDRFQQKVGDAVDRLQAEFPRRTNQLIAVAAVVLAVALGAFYAVEGVRSKADKDAAALGEALAAREAGNFADEKAELEKFLATNPSTALVRAKAELLLANIHYLERDFAAAETAFRASAKDAGSVDMIAAAARHGLASTLMQKGDWAAAAAEWESFVSSYGRRSGTAREQAAGKESFDDVALVPDALLKLAFVRLETGDKEKAKAACERILTSYGDSRAASQARTLLNAI